MCYVKKSSSWVATALAVVVAIVLGFVIHIPVAQAETSYEITSCYSGTFTDLLRSEELTILTTDVKGIAVSNHENKIFNNCSFHTTQIIQIMNGKWKRSGYTKFMDPDGDYFFVEISGEKSAVLKFLYGTGKWKGITGTGKFERIARGKAIEPGTFQGCVRNTGTFELQK
jgi:hypothetical protein